MRNVSSAVEHRGVQLVASETIVALRTRWFRAAATYRRPSRVDAGNGVSIRVRDQTMIVRVVAVVLAMLMKGMRR